MFSKLNDAESDSAYGRFLAEWDVDVVLEQINCPINEEHQRGGRRITDLNVVLPPPPVHDIVWTWYSDCLIQDHVLKLLRDAHLTGFDVKPVKARFKYSSAMPPTLWELYVTGSAGMAPPDSGIHLIEVCPACGLRRYSGCSSRERLIDASQWDGSDFFRVEPLGYEFVTDRVAALIRDNHITGVTLQTLSELPLRPDNTY